MSSACCFRRAVKEFFGLSGAGESESGTLGASFETRS